MEQYFKIKYLVKDYRKIIDSNWRQAGGQINREIDR